MNDPGSHHSEEALIAEAAARWTIRRDRGLSATESIDYELWLAADERHRTAMRRSAKSWALLDRIPDDVARRAVAESTRRRSFWRRTVTVGLSVAAILVIGLTLFLQLGTSGDADFAEPRLVRLSDGTVVQLNAGAHLTEAFTPDERRVVLHRGEAHFSVTKNPRRPFVVRARDVDVRAVGTAFNVNLQAQALEVLVTEGSVSLDAPGAGASSGVLAAEPGPRLNRGQRATVSLAGTGAPPIVVASVDGEEISRVLAWREPLMRLGGATLAELAAGFEERTGRRVVLADASLGELQIGGRFRADDVDGFAEILAKTLEVEVERADDGTLILRRKKIHFPDNGN